MNKKQIIIGSIIVFALIIIIFVALNTDSIFKGSSLDLDAEVLNNSDNIDDVEKQIESTDIEFVNMNELTNYLTTTEVDDLEKKLSQLFIEYFPRIAGIRSDYRNYYSQNKQEIQAETGIESEKEFISLINKLKPVQNYKKLNIVLQPESLKVVENNYFVDFNVVFDEHGEVEFYTIIDLNNLGLIMK